MHVHFQAVQMRLMMLQQDKNLTELIASKEQEWKELQACQTQLLESALQDTTKQLQEQKEKFKRLKEDFLYNLQVLEEREQQMKQYDAMINKLKVTDSAKRAEASSLRIQAEKLQQVIVNETRMHEELQYQYQQRLREHKIELEKLHSSKDNDIDHHRETYKKLKCQLERKVKEVEGELALQRQELLLEFDAEMKKREHEFHLQINEMNTVVLSHELKVKMLMKELEVIKVARLTATESLQTAETKIQELEEKVKCQDWELKDLSILKDARVKELEDKIQWMELSWKKKEEKFQKKLDQLDRLCREKDAVLATVKKTHTEQFKALENQICDLQTSSEALEMELHKMEQEKVDALAEKEVIIEKLKGELNKLQSSWNSHIAEMSKETISVTLQIQSLQQEKMQLKAELARLQQNVDRYREQLSQALEKEHVLEQEKVQVELDWKKLCEDAERKQYEKSEELIQGLTTARDKALAVLQERERKLQEMEITVSTITFEKDHAIQMLQKYEVLPKKDKQTFPYDLQTTMESDFRSGEIQKLQEENAGLRTVIAEMRKEMEALCHSSASTSVSAREQIPATVTSPIQGTLHMNKVCPVSDSKNLESRSIVTQLTHKELQDNPLDGPGYGDGPHQSVGCAAHVLHGRLKEAIKKISQLTQEKKQLLEIGNRLKAELELTRSEGCKPPSSSPQPAVHFVSSAVHPKDLVQKAQSRLFGLEQLQYQLTTQELQYAQRQHSPGLSVAESKIAENIHENQTARIQTWPKSPMAISDPDQNKLPEFYQTLQSGSPRSEDVSLQDLWQILDMGSSLSASSTQNDTLQVKPLPVRTWRSQSKSTAAHQESKSPFVLEGIKAEMQQKSNYNKPNHAYSTKTTSSQQMLKIRNYNLRD